MHRNSILYACLMLVCAISELHAQEYRPPRAQRELGAPISDDNLARQFQMMQHLQNLVQNQSADFGDSRAMEGLKSGLEPEQLQQLEQLLENQRMLEKLKELSEQLGVQGNVEDMPGDSLREKLENSGLPRRLLDRFADEHPGLDELLDDPQTLENAQQLMEQLKAREREFGNGEPEQPPGRFPNPQTRPSNPSEPAQPGVEAQRGPDGQPRTDSRQRRESQVDDSRDMEPEEIPNPFEEMPSFRGDEPPTSRSQAQGQSTPPQRQASPPRPSSQPPPQPFEQLTPPRISDRNPDGFPQQQVPRIPQPSSAGRPSNSNGNPGAEMPQGSSSTPPSTSSSPVPSTAPRGERQPTDLNGNTLAELLQELGITPGGNGGQRRDRAVQREPDRRTPSGNPRPFDEGQGFQGQGAQAPGAQAPGAQGPGATLPQVPSNLPRNDSQGGDSQGGDSQGGDSQGGEASSGPRVPRMSEILREVQRDPSSLPPLSLPSASVDAFQEWLSQNKPKNKEKDIFSRLKDSLPKRVRDELQREGLEQALSDIVSGARRDATTSGSTEAGSSDPAMAELAEQAQQIGGRSASNRGSNGNPAAGASSGKKDGKNPTDMVTSFFKAFTGADQEAQAKDSGGASSGTSGSGGSMDLGAPNGGLWLLALAALVGGLALWKFKTERKEADTSRKELVQQLAQLTIRTRADVIQAFHGLANCAGYVGEDIEHWWTHVRVQDRLTQATPAQAEFISALTQLYEVARYEPMDKELTPEQLKRARQAMERLSPC